MDSLSSMWKIGGKIGKMKMSDVVSTLDMLRNFRNSRDSGRGGKRTFRTDRGAAGGSGTSTGSTFNILRGRNESLTSCKKASASDTCSELVPVLGGGW